MSISSISKQIKSLKLAIKALENERRTNYAAGNAAYRSGIRGASMKGDITGDPSRWADIAHQKYMEHTEAIRQLEDMIEILEEYIPKKKKIHKPHQFRMEI